MVTSYHHLIYDQSSSVVSVSIITPIRIKWCGVQMRKHPAENAHVFNYPQ